MKRKVVIEVDTDGEFESLELEFAVIHELIEKATAGVDVDEPEALVLNSIYNELILIEQRIEKIKLAVNAPVPSAKK